jgi:hypothetical protein
VRGTLVGNKPERINFNRRRQKEIVKFEQAVQRQEAAAQEE